LPEPESREFDAPETPAIAPFPAWANTVTRVVGWSVLFLVIGVPAVLMGWVRSPWTTLEGERVDQPIAFDHRHHVRDDGIDCRYCHYDAERSAHAGIPDTSLCMGCHAQVWKDSPLLEPVRRSWFENRPIRWRHVTLLPDFVYFDHHAHVQNGVPCESCHGRVDLMASVYQATPMDMGFCLDCHRNPANHFHVPAGLEVHPPTHCSGCHR
jgi:hypothetical protein